MPSAIALRSFDHNGRVKKGDTVTFDRVTLDALRRSMLVGPDIDADGTPVAKVEAQKAPAPTVGSLGKAPKPKAKAGPVTKPQAGKKSVASPAAPASQEETLPPSLPGALPPPLPEK